MNGLKLGADPETFVKNRQGQLVSAPNVLHYGPGDIKVVPNITRFGNFYPDGAAIEFGPLPADTKEEFVTNINGLLVMAHNAIGPEYNLHAIPAANFPQEQLEHPMCRVLGCDPDADSFRRKMNVVPKGAAKKPYRTTGGHIHFGNDKGHEYLLDFDGALETVNTFELLVGIPSLKLDHHKDAIERRQLYGMAGSHRIKPYGVEARSLSSYWMQHPDLVGYVYDLSMLTGREMLEKNLKGFDKYKLPNIINKGNLKAAEEVFKEIVQIYPEIQAGYERVEHLGNMDKNIPLHETWKISREE